MSVNKVILIGNVGKDPEKRTFDNGKSVVNLSLATSESWKDKDGNKKESTEWHNLTFFSPLAEVVNQWIKKGSQIYVEGKIKTEKYIKDNADHYSTKIVCNEMRMLGKKDGNDQSKPNPMDKVKNAAFKETMPECESSMSNGEDCELPF